MKKTSETVTKKIIHITQYDLNYSRLIPLLELEWPLETNETPKPRAQHFQSHLLSAHNRASTAPNRILSFVWEYINKNIIH